MAEEKKKHKSGYTILRNKLAKKETEIEELKHRLSLTNIESLEKEVALWKNKCNTNEQRVESLQRRLKKAISQMGWLRRLIYGY